MQVDEILLSQNIIQDFNLPLYCRYELTMKGKELWLGPFVGFLLTFDEENLDQYVHFLSDYLYFYEEIGGTVIAFSLQGINSNRLTVKGLIFNPASNQWEKGVFPYPSSFFIKSKMIPYPCIQHFQSVIGHTIFNNFHFDKWEMYQILNSFPPLKKYLPDSKLYGKPEDILNLLKQQNDLFIKPLNGSRGRSIYKLSSRNKGIAVRYRDHTRMITKGEAKRVFKERLKKKAFIIQKSVDLISYEKKVIDFRIIMTRNGFGEWMETGIIARYGKKGSIVSNIRQGGTAEKGELALKKFFLPEEVSQIKQEMSLVARQVAECLDKTGVHCANMGVDIGLDRNKKLWIIEIQHNNPDHTLALDGKDRGGYLQTLYNHMLYLKKLSGFASEMRSEGRNRR